MEVAQKTVVVTGGATGMGRAIALKFAQLGANVCINYRASVDAANECVALMTELGVKAKAYQADIGREEDVVAMFEAIGRDFGGMEVLVNCAGKTHVVAHDDLYGMKGEFFDDIFNVNIKGTFFCCREAKRFLDVNGGVIINITSTAGVNALGSSIAYSASKAAEINMSRALSRVFAPKVRVLSVAPGFVATRFTQGQEARGERIAAETPMKRLATSEDIADIVSSLVTGNDYLTGLNILVDGGRTVS